MSNGLIQGCLPIVELKNVFEKALRDASVIYRSAIEEAQRDGRKAAPDICDPTAYRVSVEDNENLIVDGPNGEIIIVSYPNQGAIRFISKYRVSDGISYPELIQFVNQVNLRTLGVRACIPSQVRGVVFDYSLYLWGGVTPGSIVVSFQEFDRLVQGIITDNPGIF